MFRPGITLTSVTKIKINLLMKELSPLINTFFKASLGKAAALLPVQKKKEHFNTVLY